MTDTSDTMRRVFQRWPGGSGSSDIALKAMAVLYDAGAPLTLDELGTRLLERLDVYERAFLEARDLHIRQSQRRWMEAKRRAAGAKRRAASVDALSGERASTLVRPIEVVVGRWLMQVFVKRSRDGSTLVQDPDGRLRPGATAPYVRTLTNELHRYTPEMRQRLEQEEHDAGRRHRLEVEWAQTVQPAIPATVEARVQVVILILRRLWLGTKTHAGAKPPLPLDERKIGPLFNRVVFLADTPAVKQKALELAIADLVALLPHNDDRDDVVLTDEEAAQMRPAREVQRDVAEAQRALKEPGRKPWPEVKRDLGL
jgi:hypothetical protein